MSEGESKDVFGAVMQTKSYKKMQVVIAHYMIRSIQVTR